MIRLKIVVLFYLFIQAVLSCVDGVLGFWGFAGILSKYETRASKMRRLAMIFCCTSSPPALTVVEVVPAVYVQNQYKVVFVEVKNRLF